jgi:hypothetical protein
MFSEFNGAGVSSSDSGFDVHGDVSSSGIFFEWKQALLNVNIHDTVKAL